MNKHRLADNCVRTKKPNASLVFLIKINCFEFQKQIIVQPDNIYLHFKSFPSLNHGMDCLEMEIYL